METNEKPMLFTKKLLCIVNFAANFYYKMFSEVSIDAKT